MKSLKSLFIFFIIGFALSSCVVVHADDEYFYDNCGEYSSGGTSINADIQKLDISWIAGSVKIVETDNDKVSFEERATCSLSKSRRLHYWKNGKTLLIKFCESSFPFQGISKDLTIFIPKGTVLEEVIVDTVSAEVSIDRIHSKEYNFNTVSGNFGLKTDSLNYLNMDSVSGDLDIQSDYIDTLDFNTISGDCVFKINKGKDIEVDTVSGSAEFYLPKELGFNLNADTFGKVHYNMEVRGRGDTYIYGTPELFIDFDSTSGNVTVTN